MVPPSLSFSRARSGVPEVDIHWVRAHPSAARLVDVREVDEIEQEGSIAGAERIPLALLPDAATRWRPREPIVLVCRSGRRSSRAVLLLERVGFSRVASMTGGMVAWELAGYPIERSDPPPRAASEQPPSAVTAQSLEEALRATPLRLFRAASLLLFGSESCVDGREEHAVVGTPGGDAGELLLALATAEDLVGRALHDDEIASTFDAYTTGFGRFYLHTDEDALERLRVDLERDPRFAAVGVASLDMATLVSRPSPVVQDALIEHLLKPDNVGCGHLRLALTFPDAYGVRGELARSLARVVFRRWWDNPEVIDFVVLHGHHHEEAVVSVSLQREVHAFTNVPAVPPRIAGHSVFVNHPEVAAFMRRERAKFLFEELPALSSSGITLSQFGAALAEKAEVQLRLTLSHLANSLPLFELRFTEAGAQVSPITPAPR